MKRTQTAKLEEWYGIGLAIFYAVCLPSIIIGAIMWPPSIIFSLAAILIGVCFLIHWSLKNVVFICSQCSHPIRPEGVDFVLSLNNGDEKLLRCPKCDERSWCKAISVKDLEEAPIEAAVSKSSGGLMVSGGMQASYSSR